MKNSSIRTIDDNLLFFSTPQFEDVLHTLTEEINNDSRIICVIGPQNSGKSHIINHFIGTVHCKPILYDASSRTCLQSFFPEDLSPFVYTGNSLKNSKLLQRVLVFIDNAQDLNNADLKFLTQICQRTKKAQFFIQCIIVGTGELITNLNTQENRVLYNEIQRLINIPKLNREQSLEYITYLLSSSGCSQDIIINQDALVLKAEGQIGKLRMLTITMAYKALGEQKTTDCRLVLEDNDQFSEVDDAQPTKTSISFSLFLFFSVCVLGLSLYVFYGTGQ